MSDDINDFLDGPQHNEKKVLKQKLMSIVSSINVKKEEDENIKEICHDLKAAHGIPPKIAKRVAAIMADPEKLEKMHSDNEAVQVLFDTVSS